VVCLAALLMYINVLPVHFRRFLREVELADAFFPTSEVIRAPDFPQGSSVLMEEDVLYYFLISRPDYLQRALALPGFLALPPDQKVETLRKFNFIYLLKPGNEATWSFFNYLSDGDWTKDPMRNAIAEVATKSVPKQIQGIRFEPGPANDNHMIIKIKVL
jgi:hypothetical protein